MTTTPIAAGPNDVTVSRDFKREPRYVVFKIKDALAHLSACELDRLQEIGEKIAAGRAADGKPPFNAVVVEQDWPEFEPTWAAIEARCQCTTLGPDYCKEHAA